MKKIVLLYGFSIEPVKWILLGFVLSTIFVRSAYIRDIVLAMGVDFAELTGLNPLKYLFMQIFIVNAFIWQSISNYKGVLSLPLYILDSIRISLNILPFYDLKLKWLYYSNIHEALFNIELLLLLGVTIYGFARFLHYSDTFRISYFDSKEYFTKKIRKVHKRIAQKRTKYGEKSAYI
jgi:hypothetical protein